MGWNKLHSLGTKKQNIGGFSEAQEAPGLLPVWSRGSFFFPLRITERSPDPPWASMGLVSRPQSRQPLSPNVLRPLSLIPSASFHLRNSWENAGLIISQPWFPVCSPKTVSGPQNCRDASLSCSRCVCAFTGEGETINIPSWIHSVRPAFSASLVSVTKWKHSQVIWPRHPNNFRRSFQCGNEAQNSLDIRPVQENSAPNLSRDGKHWRKWSGAKKTVFPFEYPDRGT